MTKNNIKQPKPHGVRYPWESWFGSTPITLKRGIHYKGYTHGFYQTALQAARRHGVRISVSHTTDTLTIRSAEPRG